MEIKDGLAELKSGRGKNKEALGRLLHKMLQELLEGKTEKYLKGKLKVL